MIASTKLEAARRWPTLVPAHALSTGHDALAAGLAFAIAVTLRLWGEELDPEQWQALTSGVLVATLVMAVVAPLMGLHRHIWRFTSVDTLRVIVRVATVSAAVSFAALWALDRAAGVPRSVPLIQWCLLLLVLGGPRIAYREIASHGLLGPRRRFGPNAMPVLLVGVNDRTVSFLRHLQNEPEPPYRVVGLVEPARRERHGVLMGVPILGGLDDLPRAFAKLEQKGKRPQRVVLAVTLPQPLVPPLLQASEQLGFVLNRLPSPTELRAAGDSSVLDLQPMQLEELLRRPELSLDRDAIAGFIAGRRVLVTGAGGSIGSELVRQICRLEPARILLLDNSEFNLYQIDQQIGRGFPAVERQAALADVRDRQRIVELFARERPELVFHAAALKHVPMVELNPCEGVLTNVIGTRNVADAALACGVAAMVQVSTDKAVNPTSIMGATKRLAELYVQALDSAQPRFMTVRFGNVLGSSGSVVPLFREQIAAGGPVTVTHPEIRRYFMTIKEAVSLVLQASAQGVHQATQRGQIYVLDMGQPVRVLDLADQMIRLAGLVPEADIAIRFVGLRPGEKLYEELFDDTERSIPGVIPGVMAAASRPLPPAVLRDSFNRLEIAAHGGHGELITALVGELIPGFRNPLPIPAVA